MPWLMRQTHGLSAFTPRQTPCWRTCLRPGQHRSPLRPRLRSTEPASFSSAGRLSSPEARWSNRPLTPTSAVAVLLVRCRGPGVADLTLIESERQLPGDGELPNQVSCAVDQPGEVRAVR